MRKQKVIIAILGATFLTFGCSTLKVATDYDREAKFSDYKTYRIIQNDIRDNNTELVFNELNRSRIERALENNLDLMGMNKSDQPDLFVSYSMGTEIRKNYNTSATHMDMGGPWRGWYWGGVGMGSTHSTTQEYNTMEGQLAVSLIDAQSNKLLWYGVASKEISGNGKNAEKKINEAIEKIFRTFPMDKKLPEDESGTGITLND